MPRRSARARKLSAPTLAALRSSVTNGSSLFVDRIDERGAWARRLRDLISDHTSDLGGEDAISTAERGLIRRASMLTLQCELMERNWSKNEDGLAGPKSLDCYQRACNTLRRTLESLGLQRRQSDVTPSLREYLTATRKQPSNVANLTQRCADAYGPRTRQVGPGGMAGLVFFD